jgi:cyanate lyase
VRSFPNIQKLITNRRKQLNISYKQINIELGVPSRSTFVYAIEYGYASVPLKHVKKLASVLIIPDSEITKALTKDYERQIILQISGEAECKNSFFSR